jgi:hypothetical protein
MPTAPIHIHPADLVPGDTWHRHNWPTPSRLAVMPVRTSEQLRTTAAVIAEPGLAGSLIKMLDVSVAGQTLAERIDAGAIVLLIGGEPFNWNTQPVDADACLTLLDRISDTPVQHAPACDHPSQQR